MLKNLDGKRFYCIIRLSGHPRLAHNKTTIVKGYFGSFTLTNNGIHSITSSVVNPIPEVAPAANSPFITIGSLKDNLMYYSYALNF